MKRQTEPPRGRRRTRSGLPVDGALPPQAPRVLHQRHTGTWLSLTVLLLVVVGGTVLWHLQRDSYFTVNQVQVLGTSRLDPATVVRTSGATGREIWETDPKAIQHTLEGLPLVQSAGVRRIWPHTVAIDIVERQPVGTWQIGGVNYLVDREGVVLDIARSPLGTTIYVMDAAPALRPGDRVDAELLQAGEQTIHELPPKIAQQVAKLEYSADNGLQVVTDHGVQARLGDGRNLDYKLAVWQAVNKQAGPSQIHLIDLRFQDTPYFR